MITYVRQAPYYFMSYLATVRMLFHLDEGKGTKLYSECEYGFCEIANDNIQWKLDDAPVVLCPPDFTPIPNIADDGVCCKESFVYRNGYNKAVPATSVLNFKMNIPSGPLTWWDNTDGGSICMYMMIVGNTPSLVSSAPKTLLSLPPLYFTFYVSDSKITVSFDHNNGTNLTHITTRNITAKLGVWNAFCFAFSNSGNFSIDGQGILNNTGGSIANTISFIPNPATNTGPILTDMNKDYPIIIKNFMMMKKRITLDQFNLIYWGNPDLICTSPVIPPSDIIAFWPLTESGEFKSKCTSTDVMPRSGIQPLGPSWRVSLFAEPTATYTTNPFNPADTTGYYSIRKGLTSRDIYFADVALRGYLYTRHASIGYYGFIENDRIKPLPLVYSKYLGLIINDGAAYNSYVNKISCNAASGGISIWFFPKTMPTTLFSVYGSNSRLFSFISSSVPSIGVESTTESFTGTPSISSNAWHHVFLFWGYDVAGTLLNIIMLLDGTTVYTATHTFAPADAIPASLLQIGTILVGGKYSTGTLFDTSTSFIGYIRRVELINNSVYSWTVDKLIPNENIRLFSGNFVQLGMSCGFYDPFTSSCFSTLGPTRKPDNSGNCPSTCEATYGTTCDSTGTCDACTDEMCTFCYLGKCLQCKSNNYLASTGKCACISGTFYSSASKACVSCDSTCRTCSQHSDPFKCTSCASSRVFLMSSGTEGSCVTSCPNTMTADDSGVCRTKCHSSCKTCAVALNETRCTSCIEGFFLIGGVEGTCQSSCPNNTAYNDTSHNCEPCHSNCLTCLLPGNSTACLLCPQGTFKTETWSPSVGTCEPMCSTLNDTYADEFNRTCYPNATCPISLYKNSTTRKCEQCHQTCFGCALPKDAYACKGCVSQMEFLQMERFTSPFGTCIAQCDSEYEVDVKRRICYKLVVSKQEQQQASTIADTINGVTTAASFTSMVTSMFLSGNVGALAALLGPLQVMNLFSIVNIPKIPVKLSMFFKQLGILSFEFLPNAVTIVFPESITKSEDPSNELPDAASNHASLNGKLFLVNIGNTITLYLIVGVYAIFVLILAPHIAYFKKQKLALQSFVLEFVVLNYMELLLSSAIQIRYGVLVGFIVYVWFCIRININRLDEDMIKEKYGSFYGEYNVEGYGKWTSVVFLVIRLASIFGLVFGNSNPTIQVGAFFMVNLAACGWTALVRPQNSVPVWFGSLMCDIAAVISNCIYFKLCDAGLSELETEELGDAIFYLYISVSGINVMAGFVKSGVDLYEWWIQRGITKSESVYSISKPTEPIKNNDVSTTSNAYGQQVDPDAPQKIENNFLREDLSKQKTEQKPEEKVSQSDLSQKSHKSRKKGRKSKRVESQKDQSNQGSQGSNRSQGEDVVRQNEPESKK